MAATAPRPNWDAAPLLAATYRAAVTGADAYRAVRQAVQVVRGILRAGNRFTRLDRIREIAFVSLGNASASMALGVQRALGERLTQGFVAGPVPLPPEVAFRSAVVPPGPPGSSRARQVAASVRELEEGLRSDDLLLLLLSAGAFPLLTQPPEGADAGAFALLDRVRSRAGEAAAVLVARCASAGLVGGGIGRRANGPRVETLVVDDGNGAARIGGGPTVPVSPREREEARSLLRTLGEPDIVGSVPLSSALPEVDPFASPRASRPVVIASPADAVRGAGDHLADRRWITRLASLQVPGGPEGLAAALGARAEEEFRKLPSRPLASDGRPAAGLAVFAGSAFDGPEGGSAAGARDGFLAAAAREVVRREAVIAYLPTSGDLDGSPAGGYVGQPLSSESTPAESRRQPLAMPAGVTDVGTVALWLLPFPRAG